MILVIKKIPRSNALIVHYSNHYQIVIPFLNPEFSFLILPSTSRSISDDSNGFKQLSTFYPLLVYTQRWSFVVPILLSSSQSNENVRDGKKSLSAWKERRRTRRLNSSSRILVASGFRLLNVHIFSLAQKRYAEFPIPKLIFASSNFDISIPGVPCYYTKQG